MCRTGYLNREKGKETYNYTHNYKFSIEFYVHTSKLHHQNVFFKPCTDPMASTKNHTPKSTIYSFGFGILKGLLASY